MTSEAMPIIYLPHHLAQGTARLLESFASLRPSEGVVYWFGLETDGAAVVSTVVVPNADTTGGTVRTSAQVNADTIRLIIDTPLRYLGQAHSHPGAEVFHSIVDDEQTFARFDGAISVVVPWFGRYGLHPNQCGVYRHICGKFRAVKDIDAHLRLIPGVVDMRPAIHQGGLNVHHP